MVADQELGENGTVTITSVTSDTVGWLVIHAQADGKPGPILGSAPVAAGENSDVVVEIDPGPVRCNAYQPVQGTAVEQVPAQGLGHAATDRALAHTRGAADHD